MADHIQLEEAWARWNNLPAEGMVCCSSGTAALHLALEALRLPKGSEVITCDFNMVAVPIAIELAGLVPVFVDCDERLLIDVDQLSPGLESIDKTHKMSAIIVVHIYGRQCDMFSVHLEAEPRGLTVIEDLAEAHGVKPHPLSSAACYSFYKNKIVAGQEGGAVWFKDPAHATIARQLRCLGFTEEHNFLHIPRGHNYRMSPAHADLIHRHLIQPGNEGASTQIKQRWECIAWYDALCPNTWKLPTRQAPWVYDLRIPNLTWEKQSTIVKSLNTHNIQARMSFKPMSMQEQFKHCRVITHSNPSNTHILSNEVFYLPLAPMDQITQNKITETFHIIHKTLNG